MKEAGYEWDAEKKELTKIENEIEIPFGAKDSELQEVTYYIPEGFHAEIEDNNVVIKKGEQKHNWSEEDREMMDEMMDYMKPMPIFFEGTKGKSGKEYTNEFIKNATDWLKSIKERVQPQPKQGWCKEDERRINHIITFMSDKERIKDTETMFPIEEDIRWLKSLKAIHTWKPSDEQIKVCKEVYADLLSAKGFDICTVNSELNRLEKDLKKLKG